MSAEDERTVVWRAIEKLGLMHGALEERVDTIPGQLDEIRKELGAGGERFEKIEAVLAEQGRALAENTTLTKAVDAKMGQQSEVLADIAKAQVFARTVVRVVSWCGRSTKRAILAIGAIATALTALWVGLYAATHGGKLP